MRNERAADTIGELVYQAMATGEWWSLPELAAYLRARGRRTLDTTISARVRDLRKSPWHRSVRTRTREGQPHTVEYALLTVEGER